MGKNNLAVVVKAILFSLFALTIFIAGCADYTQNSSNADKDDNLNDKNDLKPAFKTFSTGSTDSGDVLIELTPKGMKSGKFEVDISLNTHSVDLGQFDLVKVTSLEYEGKAIKPVSAPELSGHHGSGTMVFDTGKEIKNFKVTIKGIPAVEERVSEWS